MPRRYLLLPTILVGCWLAAGARAETITVGSFAAGCDFSTLSAAVSRAASTSGSDSILLTVDATWIGGSPLQLTNESSVTFQGITSCGDFTAIRRTITTTAGDLFLFDGTSVTFRNLDLVGDTAGRLVVARNASIITLRETTLRGGQSASAVDDGGNVSITDGASLVALSGSEIVGGQALNGGGVYCEASGNSTIALGAGSRVADNLAVNSGGGIYADECTVSVFSGGPSTAGRLGVFGNHSDGSGGGIYAESSSVIVGGTASFPGSIRGNTSAGAGGGLYLRESSAEITDSEVVGNLSGSDGGGFYLALYSTLTMHRTLASCGRGFRCSLLAGNRAGFGSATGLGGAVHISGNSDAEVLQTYVTDNAAASDAGQVAYLSDVDTDLLIEGSVLFDNAETGIQISSFGHTRLAFVSAWGSSEPGSSMAFAEVLGFGRLDFYSSLIVEGRGNSPLGGSPDPILLPPGPDSTFEVNCSFLHEDASTGSTFPVFTDPATLWPFAEEGNPGVNPGALAVDYCNTAVYAPVDDDIDGEPRGLDISIGNILGPYDLGADESDGSFPVSEEIFSDGFESGNVSAWSSSI